MKKILLSFAAIIAMVSCAKVIPDENSKFIEVGFRMGGEVLSIDNTPLTKVDGITPATVTMYGIQVYQLITSQDALTGNPYTHYEPYANGVFTDLTSLQNAKVQLLNGEKYKFEAQVVRNMTYDSSWGSIPPCPFMYTPSPYNQFNVGTTPLSLTSGSYATAVNSRDRYYGYEEDFEPDPKDASKNIVTINTYHVSFGLKVVLNNLTEGSVSTTIGGTMPDSMFPAIVINHDPLKSDNTYSAQETYVLNDFNSAYQAAKNKQDYTESKTVNFVWTKGDNVTSVSLITPQQIDFHRNQLTTITINIVGENPEGSVSITYEEQFADDPTVHEFNSGSSTGTGTNITQNP